MAFCKYCGTQLEEGQSCTCAQSQEPQQATINQQTTNNPQINIQIDKEKITNISQSFIATVINVFKSPVTGARGFVRSGNLAVSLVIIAIQAILTSLIFTVMAGKINDLIPMITLLPVEKVFFSSLAISLLSSLGFAGLMFVVDSLIFKGTSSFKSMCGVSATNSLISAPFVILAIVVGAFSNFSLTADIAKLIAPVVYPIAISLVGGMIGKFTASKVIDDASENSETKKFFVFIISWVIITVVTVMLAGSVISSLLSSIGEDVLSSIFGGLSDFASDMYDWSSLLYS